MQILFKSTKTVWCSVFIARENVEADTCLDNSAENKFGYLNLCKCSPY